MFTTDAITSIFPGYSSGAADRLNAIHPGSEVGAANPIDDRFGAALRNLEGLDTAAGRKGPSLKDQAYEAARELVSVALIQPMLKLAREDPFQTELFHGGQTEEVFGGQLDQHVADHLVRSIPLGIVDAIYREALGKGHTETTNVPQGRYDTKA